MVFLQLACTVASRAVYSLHKTSTRQHVMKKAKEWGMNCQIVAELKFDVSNLYKFHKQKSVDVQVDFIRLSK
jgi:predicted RNA methylase